jgi:hypothetical protein
VAGTTPVASPRVTSVVAIAQYRVIDFKRNDKDGVNARVAEIARPELHRRASRCCISWMAQSAKHHRLGTSSTRVTSSSQHRQTSSWVINLPLVQYPAGTVIHAIELKLVERWFAFLLSSLFVFVVMDRFTGRPYPVRSATSTHAAAPRSARSANAEQPNINRGKLGPYACAGRAFADRAESL